LEVFGIGFVFHIHTFSHVVTFFATVAILFGSIYALRQTSLRRMLCFVVITEIGYLVSGLGIGNVSAIKGAILHMLNDISMTFCLFLSLLAIEESQGPRIGDLKSLFQQLPFVSAIFLLAWLSVVGIPPTCGFFGKWYLLKGALEAQNVVLLVAILLSSLMNALLLFKIVESAYYAHGDVHGSLRWNWGHWTYGISLVIVGLSVLVMGIFSGLVVERVVDPFLGEMGL
jgi:multicomponent Na+:H+ antiporter subunit D